MVIMGVFKTVVRQESRPMDLVGQVPGAKAKEVSKRVILGESAFVSMLYLERRRAERAQKRFVLMLVDVKEAIADNQKVRTLGKITNTLSDITRETDVIGWYLEDNLVGVLGTEIGTAKAKQIQERLSERLRGAFREALGSEKSDQIFVSFHFFPEEWEDGDSNHSANIALYPDLARQGHSKKFALGLKRAMDIVGSATGLVLLSP